LHRDHTAFGNFPEVGCQSHKNFGLFCRQERGVNGRNFPLAFVSAGFDDVKKRFKRRVLKPLAKRILLGLAKGFAG
jgi:hypothetical protein